MKYQINRFLLATSLYFFICWLSTFIFTPYSTINFVGPAAGIATAIAISWATPAFVAIFSGSLLFFIYLILYVDSATEPAVLLISMLAIFLQAYVAKQFVANLTDKQAWLANRSSVVRFVLLLGPVAAIISSIIAVIIDMLDNQRFDSSPFYVFGVNYSCSVLVAILVTPLLLFTHGQQKLSLSKRFYIAVASVLVCIAIALQLKVSVQRQHHERMNKFTQSKSAVLADISHEIEGIGDKLTTMAAFFKASEYISAYEFTTFANIVFGKSLSVHSVYWVPAVSMANKDLFEQSASRELLAPYQIVEKETADIFLQAQARDLYMPVYYMHPKKHEQLYGLDLLTLADQQVAMNMSAKLNRPVATPPQEIYSHDFYFPKLLVYFPVYSGADQQNYGLYSSKIDQRISGFIVAQIKFAEFFQLLAHKFSHDNIDFIVEDVSLTAPYFVFGSYQHGHNPLSDVVSLDVFTRYWQLTFVEKQPWLFATKNWQTMAVFLGVTLAAVLFQLLFLIVAIYSSELLHKIDMRTQALIREKEQAEKENQAKTRFLHSLSAEFNTPINVIKKLTETFPKKGLSNVAIEYLVNITSATLNVARLIDTVSELSAIESGELTITNQPFNFIDFIKRMENSLQLRRSAHAEPIKISLAKNAPSFINSDELRIGQLFTALAENAEQIMSCHGFAVMVRVYMHTSTQASVFFVFTPPEEQFKLEESPKLFSTFDPSIGRYNTRMSMVQELCTLFGGDLKMARAPSGNIILSASIKVDVHRVLPRSTPSTDASNALLSLSEGKGRVLLVESSQGADGLLRQKFSALGYRVDVIDERENIVKWVSDHNYKVLFTDASLAVEQVTMLAKQLKQASDNSQAIRARIPIIAIFAADLQTNEINVVKPYIANFGFSSISPESLQKLLLKM